MWQVHGQDHILRQLEPSLRQDRQAHAYLLVGPPHVGKMTLALNLAQAVNCLNTKGIPCGDCEQCARTARRNHADVRIVGVASADEAGNAESGNGTRTRRSTVIGIDDIKEILHQVNLKPYQGACSVVIIDGAESMSEEAANALLKTLEEPPPQVLLLLLTTNEEALLTTVRSRCRRLSLMSMAKNRMAELLINEYEVEPKKAEQLCLLSRGCLGWAISAAADPDILAQREADIAQLKETCESGLSGRFNYANEVAGLFSKDRPAARESLFLWLRWWRDLLLIKEGAQDFVHNSDRLGDLNHQAGRLTTFQIVEFIKHILATLVSLDRNASARLALEVLMLNLPTELVEL